MPLSHKTKTTKQGNQSLGIMIIEGKHAEVGQGIFISDIQEGSNAEKVIECCTNDRNFYFIAVFLHCTCIRPV